MVLGWSSGNLRCSGGEGVIGLVEAPTPEDLRRFELNLIAVKDWGEAPEEARLIAERESKQGVPTGISHDEKFGWVVLQSSGQGPYLIWWAGDPTLSDLPTNRATNIDISLFESRDYPGMFWARATGRGADGGVVSVDTRQFLDRPTSESKAAGDAVYLFLLVRGGVDPRQRTAQLRQALGREA